MKKLLLAGAAAIGIALTSVANAAPTYTFNVRTANTPGGQFDAVPGGLAGGIVANFSYTGNLSFVNNQPQNSNSSGDLNSAFFGANAAGISSYVGAGTLGAPANANFTTLANFLASSGSASGFQYGSLYTIGLGTLAAGTILTITHDDGASVYKNGLRIGTTNAGPTTAVTENVAIGATSGDVVLYYARENGSPSVLQVAIPEPASLALFGAGLLGLGLARRRRANKAEPVAA